MKTFSGSWMSGSIDISAAGRIATERIGADTGNHDDMLDNHSAGGGRIG